MRMRHSPAHLLLCTSLLSFTVACGRPSAPKTEPDGDVDSPGVVVADFNTLTHNSNTLDVGIVTSAVLAIIP